MTVSTATVDVPGVSVHGAFDEAARRVLTPEALAFVADLHRRFDARRRELLASRETRRTAPPDFLEATADIRSDADWRVAPIPAALQDRRVEITGPVDRKMMINALNSGAKVFMADFEDSCSPTWQNIVHGQVNVADAVAGSLSFHDDAKDKSYEVGDAPALLLVRVRGWHLDEPRVTIDGEPVSGGLFDMGLFLFHNAEALAATGNGPFVYLPKLEHHLEARLWNDVFVHAQEVLGLEVGTVKATVLIETLPAVFQMDEILYELRDHMAGLNAGRWDYIFSAIKTMGKSPDHVLPDRALVGMTVPFLRAYTELLVQTCHKRGAFAMGGMSAFIPNRRDVEVTEKALTAVRADKEREARDGCDGTWVAHPDLVPVAMEIFDAALGDKPNQVDKQRPDVAITSEHLLDFTVPGGVTEEGLRTNIEVALRYIESWLRGIGAAAIHDLMEDAATAEISRSQVWQWLHHGSKTDDGTPVTHDRVAGIIDDELGRLAAEHKPHRYADARRVFEACALEADLPPFLTILAQPLLDPPEQP